MSQFDTTYEVGTVKGNESLAQGVVNNVSGSATIEEFDNGFQKSLLSSDYEITASGITPKVDWDFLQDFFAYVKESNPKFTLLKCAIDNRNKIYEDRVMDTEVLSKVVKNISKGKIILIKVRQGYRDNQYQSLTTLSDGTGMLANVNLYFSLPTAQENVKFSIEDLGEII